MHDEFLLNTGQMCLDFETCERAEPPAFPPLISWPEGFRARTSAMPDAEPDWTASDLASGGSLLESFASFDQDMSLWKTYQLSLFEGLTPYSGRWPRSGMMRSGTAYRLPPLVPLTAVTASSLLPTPRAHEAGDYQYSRGDKSKPILTLTGRVKQGMWPTPNVPNGSRQRKSITPTGMTPDGKKRQVDLQHAVRMVERGMWPTPSASPWRSGCASPETLTRNSRPLNEVIAAQEGGGALNPTWVEWLMGFPLGWTDLEE